MPKYTVTLIEDNEGNLILPLPKELFEGSNPWLENDDLEWDVDENNSATISNISWKNRNKS